MSLDDKVGQMCELASDLFTDGALSIMVNSGNDNSMPFHTNYELLTKWAQARSSVGWYDCHRLGRYRQSLQA